MRSRYHGIAERRLSDRDVAGTGYRPMQAVSMKSDSVYRASFRPDEANWVHVRSVPADVSFITVHSSLLMNRSHSQYMLRVQGDMVVDDLYFGVCTSQIPTQCGGFQMLITEMNPALVPSLPAGGTVDTRVHDYSPLGKACGIYQIRIAARTQEAARVMVGRMRNEFETLGKVYENHYEVSAKFLPLRADRTEWIITANVGNTRMEQTERSLEEDGFNWPYAKDWQTDPKLGNDWREMGYRISVGAPDLEDKQRIHGEPFLVYFDAHVQGAYGTVNTDHPQESKLWADLEYDTRRFTQKAGFEAREYGDLCMEAAADIIQSAVRSGLPATVTDACHVDDGHTQSLMHYLYTSHEWCSVPGAWKVVSHDNIATNPNEGHHAIDQVVIVPDCGGYDESFEVIV